MQDRRTLPGTVAALAIVVALAAAVRMPFWLSSVQAYAHGDAILWEVWSRAIHQHGFLNVFRTTDSNYVGYHYVLWPTSAIYSRISPEYELWTPAIRILIKIPPFVCDLALGALIFFIARSLLPRSDARRNLKAALASCAFTLAPGSVYDSMWWSQNDSVITLSMLGAVVLLARGNVIWAYVVLMIGIIFKPQPIVIVPVVAAFTYWRFGARALATGVAAAALTTVVVLSPFLLHGDGRRIIDTYDSNFTQDPIDLAEGAWNGWSLLDLRGDPHPEDVLFTIGGVDVTYAELSLALCAAATLVILVWLKRNLDLAGLLAASGFMVFTFYALPTSTHERYLYPLFALAAPLLVRVPRLAPLYALLSATFMLNLLAISPPTGSTFWEWHGTPFAAGVAALNLAIFVGMIAVVVAAAFRTSIVPPRSRVVLDAIEAPP